MKPRKTPPTKGLVGVAMHVFVFFILLVVALLAWSADSVWYRQGWIVLFWAILSPYIFKGMWKSTDQKTCDACADHEAQSRASRDRENVERNADQSCHHREDCAELVEPGVSCLQRILNDPASYNAQGHGGPEQEANHLSILPEGQIAGRLDQASHTSGADGVAVSRLAGHCEMDRIREVY